MNVRSCIVFLCLSLLSCKRNIPEVCPEHAALYSVSDFPLGVAIAPERMASVPEYRRIALSQFNSYTPENIMKARYLHPEPEVYDWQAADALADTCARYGIRLHGHTLIWHESLPDWLRLYEGTSSEWKQVFKDHIQSIVRHFRGRVASWDVVNEAFHEDGTLRNSLWRQKIGDEYIELAFQYAQEADPDVLLFYNDYALELNPVKRAGVLMLLDRIRSRGVRVDGVGLQMHVRLHDPDPADMSDAFSEVAAHRYRVHLSELDISVNPLAKPITNRQALLKEQATYLEQIIRCYKQLPRDYRYGITFWGLSDADSWIPVHYNREDYPLLYDQQYVPKPAYCLLKDIL